MQVKMLRSLLFLLPLSKVIAQATVGNCFDVAETYDFVCTRRRYMFMLTKDRLLLVVAQPA